MISPTDCPVCGEYVGKSHTCKGHRGSRPWVNKPSDFAARVRRSTNAARQGHLPIGDDK